MRAKLGREVHLILRSLKLVHFLGLPQTQIREVARDGVVRLPLPGLPGTDVLQAALRFAFVGALPEGVNPVSEGQGYAYVEVGFRLPGDSQASVFRGVDRRGTEQVSLREEGGLRVTGGRDDVAHRLGELLGGDVDAWCGAAFPERVPSEQSAVRASLADAIEFEPEAAAAEDGDAPAAAALAGAAVLQRSLRAERLRRLAARRHGELLDRGRVLRRTRADTAHSVDHVAGDRDRVRTRLRRINEYRDLVARAEAEQRGEARRIDRSPPGFAIEWGLATCASVLLLLLVIYSTGESSDPGRHSVQVGLGLGFMVAAASYLGIATKRHTGFGRFVVVPEDRTDATPLPPAPESPADLHESLRARFADVEGLDDPATATRLREQLSDLDAELSPLHSRLERLDDAITVFDVEAGRAARALHLPLPEPDLAETGLAIDEQPDATLSQVKGLGDSVYAVTVERDALLAGGALELQEARDAARREIGELSDSVGDPDTGTRLSDEIAAFEPDATDDPVEDGFTDALRSSIAAVTLPVIAPARAGTVAFDAAGATGGSVDALAVHGESLVAVRGETPVAWDELDQRDRDRLALSATVRASGPLPEGLLPPAFVVLGELPDEVGDADVLASLRAGRPSIVQVLVAATPEPAGFVTHEPEGSDGLSGRQRRRVRGSRRRPPGTPPPSG